jgi:hypothetical protein
VSLARRMRALPKDPYSPDGYSLIPVHVWTHGVGDVVEAAGLLGAGFEVITPEELMNRVKENVFHDCAAAVKATGSFAGSCRDCQDACGALRGCVCKAAGGQEVRVDFFDHAHCAGDRVANCLGRLVCEGDPCDCVGPAVGGFKDTCSGCKDHCGLLSECRCDAPGKAVTSGVLLAFDYAACGGLQVENCYGALVCAGDPCQ